MTDAIEGKPHASFDHSTVGGRIAWARARKGFSAAKLAKMVDRTRAAISLYETGRNQPPTEMLTALAGALDVDVRWLAFGDTLGPLQMSEGDHFAPVVVYRPTPAVRELLNKMPDAFLGIEDISALGMDAPHFYLNSGDILLLTQVGKPIAADGALYAISSTAGTLVVRSEPMIVRESEAAGRALLLTTGQGQPYRTSSDAIEVLGRVGGWLHRTR